MISLKTVQFLRYSNPCPSSTNNINALLMAPKLTQHWGHPVTIDEELGANGQIGAGQVSNVAPTADASGS